MGLQGRAGLAGPGAWLLGRALLQGRAGTITTLGSRSHATSPSYLGQFAIDSQRREPDAHRCFGASSRRVRASPGRASGLGKESARLREFRKRGPIALIGAFLLGFIYARLSYKLGLFRRLA